MGPGTRVKLTVVLACAVVLCACLLAGAAIAKKTTTKKPFTPSGSGTYEKTGQACFGAKWAGTGGWSTSYQQSVVTPNVGTSTTTYKGESSYSWDESAVAGGADCALELLKEPGSKPSGGATWNKGYARVGSQGSEVETFPTSPTVTTPCSQAASKPPSGGGFASGDMVVQSQGSTVVFEVTLGLPGEDCDYGFPGDAVPGGSVRGAFLTSTSVKVPKTVLEHASKVVIVISSDPKSGPKPNCGEPSGSSHGVTVTCSQTGAWQGTLTLYEG